MKSKGTYSTKLIGYYAVIKKSKIFQIITQLSPPSEEPRHIFTLASS